mmetsp:Transcript_27558/g.38040  ORF Transcript_27558/g.38040 Transcript_27558/m.38040 type:complete len:531 (-) Transcript_27558:118-1710(-)
MVSPAWVLSPAGPAKLDLKSLSLSRPPPVEWGGGCLQVELLARKILNNPIEIQVGGRSVVNPDIDQRVEIRRDEDHFLRLLELLGEWYEQGKVLVFVHSQDKCDTIFRDLLKSGYPCLSLHGGKEQSDRESTISDFKSNVCNVLIATSVAARGLDVKDLNLVVNYDVPNHYEDYVHRVGRTGRAGKAGTAITFITPEDEKYAPDLVRALTESSRPVPADLQQIAQAFEAKRKEGLVQTHGSGYGGTGFKFDSEEAAEKKAERKAKAKEYGMHEDQDDVFSSSDEEEDSIRLVQGPASSLSMATTAASLAAAVARAGALVAGGAPGGAASAAAAAAAATAAAISKQVQAGSYVSTGSTLAVSQANSNPMIAAAQAAAAQIAAHQSQAAGVLSTNLSSSALSQAQQKAAAYAASLGGGAGGTAGGEMEQHFESELEINDFPQQARWKVTHRDSLSQICEFTGAAITTRGQYYAPKTNPPIGERKLYLLIEGPTESVVRRAKQEIKTVLEATMDHMTNLPGHRNQAAGRYSIM